MLLWLLILSSATCQTSTSDIDFNFGFEKTTSNENLPDNWNLNSVGCDISIDTLIKHSGKNSLRIDGFYSKPPIYNLSISFEIPSQYKGKEIELRAYMKQKNIKDGSVGLILKIDGEDGPLKFENMHDKNNSGTIDWKKYSIKIPFPKETKTISIGALNSGKGQLWVDDFEILIDGKDIIQAEKKEIKYNAEKDHEFDKSSKIESIKINEQNIENLALLCKVWGFLKYYHPNIAKGDYNWDYELFRVLPDIINAESTSERDKILSDWIKGLGNFEVNKDIEKVTGNIKIKADIDWIVNSKLNQDLVNQLTKVKNAKRTSQQYYIRFKEGIGNPIFKNENAYIEMKFPDTGYRLLSLFRYWNIIQYYFPYKNLIEEDWKAVLKEFVPKFINVQNELEYKLSILKLIARIHDSHANIWGVDGTLNKFNGINCVPVEISFIENQAIVSGYYDEVLGEKSGLLKGDVISRVNNHLIGDIVKEKLEYFPASNYTTQLRNISPNLLRTNDSIIKVQLVRNGNTEIQEFKTYSIKKINFYKKFQNNDTCFKIINHNIAYLYLGSIRSGYLPEIMTKIINKKGLIIDIRCYPTDFMVFSLGEYLLPESTAFVEFSHGNINNPGLFAIKEKLEVGKKNENCYKGKIVILVNEITQSQAEYTAMAFRVAPKAILIGSTTAGADGNVSEIYLPGGIKTMISGIGVYYPDGRETQRVGIIPDIEVKPTIDGIKQNRDEVLEKAIQIINNK